MTEKVGIIKNPLTIIAIFAGIAEVSGTIVLPFVAIINQRLFIWFLIIFPVILIVSFFVTLNFNNKVLYAPSDYQDEGNYLLSNKYNVVTQTNELVREPLNAAFENLALTVSELKGNFEFYKSVNYQPPPDGSVEPELPLEVSNDDRHLFSYQVVDNMPSLSIFLNKMSKLGYVINAYRSHNNAKDEPYSDNRAIWLGADIPLSIAKEVILNAKKSFPFLSYIKIFDEESASRSEARDVFIGGSTESAIGMFKLKPINSEGFARIKNAVTLEDFHQIINSYIRV